MATVLVIIGMFCFALSLALLVEQNVNKKLELNEVRIAMLVVPSVIGLVLIIFNGSSLIDNHQQLWSNFVSNGVLTGASSCLASLIIIPILCLGVYFFNHLQDPESPDFNPYDPKENKAIIVLIILVIVLMAFLGVLSSISENLLETTLNYFGIGIFYGWLFIAIAPLVGIYSGLDSRRHEGNNNNLR